MSVYQKLGDKLRDFMLDKTEEVDDKVEAIDKHERYVNTDLDYCQLRVENSVGEYIFSSNAIFNLDTFICGNMKYDLTEHSVTLQAGKTYNISVSSMFDNIYSYMNYAICTTTGKAISPNSGCKWKYKDNYNNGTSDQELNFIYQCDEDCQIIVKAFPPSGDSTTSLRNATLVVQEINRQIVIDPVEYINTTQGIEDVPVGHIISHMGTVAPKHYLICDGTEYNITDYPYLAQHIEDNFGSISFFGGDGETTFRVPDLRGEFLRGSGTATRKTGSGAAVGVHQDGTRHQNFYVGTASLCFYGDVTTGANNSDRNITNTTNGKKINYSTYSSSSNAQYFNSRPTNTSVLYCIKYEPTYFMNTYNTNYMQPSMYSEEERVIGCWIDGKPLYEKTIKTTIPLKDTRTVIANLPENIDYVTISNCYAFSETSKMSFNFVFSGINGNNGNDCVWISLSEGIVMQLTSGINISLCYVTIQYTKTTDEENSFTNNMLKDSYVELTYSDEEISTMVSDILGGEE